MICSTCGDQISTHEHLTGTHVCWRSKDKVTPAPTEHEIPPGTPINPADVWERRAKIAESEWPKWRERAEKAEKALRDTWNEALTYAVDICTKEATYQRQQFSMKESIVLENAARRIRALMKPE